MLEILHYQFFQYALLGTLLVSVASAIIGAYVVARRMVFITGGITHASFGGLGLGFLLGFNPTVAAGAFAMLAALGVEAMTSRQNVREDTAIGVVWALGMALGALFIYLSPDYAAGLSSFLFGSILTIGKADAVAFAVLLLVLLACCALVGRQAIACAFDADFARTQGLPVRAINALALLLIATCVVLTTRLMGIMLLMAFFTIPVMTAETFTHRFTGLIVGAAAVNLLGSLAGLALSTWLAVPASCTIALTLIAFYAIVRLCHACRRKAINKPSKRYK